MARNFARLGMQAIIILGGHRCGTSVTARLIHELGFPAAPSADRLLWPQPGRESDNPDGYWEDVAFVRLHRRMLGEGKLHLGGWRNPQRDDAVIRQFRSGYRRLVQERMQHAPRWSLKDPRLCLLGDVLFETLDDLNVPFVVVSPTRSTVVVTRSLKRRGLMPMDAEFVCQRFEAGRAAMCDLARSTGHRCIEIDLTKRREASELKNELERLMLSNSKLDWPGRISRSL